MMESNTIRSKKDFLTDNVKPPVPKVDYMKTPKNIKTSHFKKRLSRMKTAKKNPKKKLRCTPLARKNAIVKGKTCYSKTTVKRVADAYNQKNADKITANDENQMYDELGKRLPGSEDSWLNMLGEDDRRALVSSMFAPKLDYAAQQETSTVDLDGVMQGFQKMHPEFTYVVSPINYSDIVNGTCVTKTLCNFNLAEYEKKGITKVGIIFNITKHDHPGDHWVSMFIDIKPTNTSETPFIYYFDSYGMGYLLFKRYSTVNDWINKFIGEVKEEGEKHGIQFQVHVNKTRQQTLDGLCGIYCLFFIVTLLTRTWYDHGENETKLTLDECLQLFHNHHLSEEFIDYVRLIYFNIP